MLFIITGTVVLAGLLSGAYFLGKSKSCPNNSTVATSSFDTTKKSSGVAQDPNGPYYHKVYAATSKDSLTWQKQEKVLFDHASVPGAVIKDGIIYLYFVDASGGAQVSVAISKDLGKSFDKQTIVIKDATLPPVDPNPVLLESGKIRLYYFTSPVSAGDPAAASGSHQIMAAESRDGINFENSQQVFAEENITDPDVFKTAKDWRMFVSKGTALDLAISTDNGLTFTKQNDFSWNNGGVPSTADINGTLRTYYCGQGGIASATGAETGKLSAEAGVRIAESNKIVCDPSVIELPDKTFLMFYKVQELTQNNANNGS